MLLHTQGEHEGKDFFETLVGFMTSGPVIKLELERPNGIKAWRALLGPTNPTVAKEQSPGSIRAQFGNSEDPEVSTQVRYMTQQPAAMQQCSNAASSNAALQPAAGSNAAGGNAAMQQCSNAASMLGTTTASCHRMVVTDMSCHLPLPSDSRLLSVCLSCVSCCCCPLLQNAAHGSDSPASAAREIEIMFRAPAEPAEEEEE